MILFPFRRATVATFTVLAAGLSSAALVTPCAAQEREVRIVRAPGGITVTRGLPANRAVLGVTLGEGSRADTAGVRLESVDANGPAGKAGLEAGDVITEINGVSLKVAREDAEDLALAGLAQRRLQRAMQKVKPGDEVRLQVRSGNATRTVTVKATSAEELARVAEPVVEERVITRGPDGQLTERRSGGARRGMIGVSIGGAGNARDTLGLFVSSVVSGGPAEKAGIIEGERIAAVNGVDVRVPREDVEDGQVASARTDRFVRAVQQVEPGKSLTLKVWGNGRYRDVTVTAQESRDLPGEAFGWEAPLMNGRLPGMRLETIPEGEVRIRRNGGEPQVFEFRRDGPARGRVRINGNEIEIDGAGLERAAEDLGRRLQERLRDVEVEVRGLRTLPERSGAVRIRATRTAV